MRRTSGLGLALVSLLLVQEAGAGGEAKLEELIKQTLATLDRLTTTLNTVRDEDTAKSALPELKKGVEQFVDLKKKAADAPPPSKAEKDRLAKEYRTKLEDARKKLLGEVLRVKEVPGSRDVLQQISPIFEKDKKADK